MTLRYFDYAASRPMIARALETYVGVATEVFANPSSVHGPGAAAAARLGRSRRALCELCGFDDGRLLLTSGGTEANNLVIQGHLRRNTEARLLIAPDVHPSIWFAVARFSDRCDVLALGADGVVEPDEVARSLRRRTSLVCVSHACNETGTVHPLHEIGEVCARRGVQLLADGAQALGHIPVDLSQIGCDFYTFSAHKFGGPRGLGGVLMRGEGLEPLFGGGGQEWSLRPGTENLAGLAATVTALESSLAEMTAESRRLERLTRFLARYLLATVPQAVINSPPDSGLPGLLSVSISGLDAHAAVVELSLLGFAVSAGSACHADQVLPSRAVLARGRSESQALGTLRISMGSETTEEDVHDLAVAVSEVAERQLRHSGGAA